MPKKPRTKPKPRPYRATTKLWDREGMERLKAFLQARALDTDETEVRVQ